MCVAELDHAESLANQSAVYRLGDTACNEEEHLPLHGSMQRVKLQSEHRANLPNQFAESVNVNCPQASAPATYMECCWPPQTHKTSAACCH